MKFCNIFEQFLREKATPTAGQANIKNEDADDSSDTRNKTKLKKEKKPDNETSESNWEFKDFSGYEEPLKREKVRLYMTFKRLFQEN